MPAGRAPHVALSRTPVLEHCSHFYRELDQLAKRASVFDAGSHRIVNHPYFRSSRFLASFESKLHQQPVSALAYRDWLVHLNLRAIGGLLIEWQRLPAAQKQTLTTRVEFPVASRQALRQKLRYCGALIVAELSGHSELKTDLLRAARVPDHYRSWKRWLGLYPLIAIPFGRGVVAEQREIASLQDDFRKRRLDPQQWNRYEYRPAEEIAQNEEYDRISAAPLLRAEATRLLSELRLDRLGIPQISTWQKKRLLATWAPQLAIERGRDFPEANRIGELKNARRRIVVDTDRPTLYGYLSFGREGEAVTVQLNYNFWFSRRPKRGLVDLLAGELDGLTWRVHLNLEGELLAMDAVHNCGCWYQLYTGERYQLQGQPGAGGEPIFHGNLPPTAAEQRLTLFMRADTHTLLGVRAASTAGAEAMTMKPYRQLRLAGIFNQKGLIPVSRRLERFLFWPMGVPSPGAMRQAGTHAIAFIGRRHFDDPHLLHSLGLQRRQNGNP